MSLFIRTCCRTSSIHQSRCFSSSVAARADFTHAVIGGGVVGLAIARQLAERDGATTVLIERHSKLGTETSSRNSEVIHAGIYYGASSLKTALCIRGKNKMYEFCGKHDVAFKQPGKWIVAQTETQRQALEKMYKFCTEEIDVPVRWVSRREIEEDGEGVRAEAGALESPTTGIVDSHGLMLCLEGLFEEAGGIVARQSPVTGIRPLGASRNGQGGWEIEVKDGNSGADAEASSSSTTIHAETIINAAGLGAVALHNMIVTREDQKKQIFYAKGNYFGYSKSSPKPSRLIYPAPEPGAGGLGTHLTMDLGGQIRFGPDVEWVQDPEDLGANAARLDQAIREIKTYLPGVDEGCLQATYAGMRPKLAGSGAVGSGKGFQDFVIRKEEGYHGWINLLGIESPGLTSSLAIAEMVDELLYGSRHGQTKTV